MRKLTFSELVDSQDTLNQNELSSILGGRGVQTGGTGTSGDPYVISATYYTVGSIPGASDAMAMFNGAPGSNTIIKDGKTYKYNVQIVECANLDAAMDAAAATTYNGVSYGNIIKTGTAYSSGGYETWGSTNGSTITINSSYVNSAFSGAEANRSGVAGAPSGISKGSFNSNLVGHEMLHTFNLGDNEGGGTNNVQSVGTGGTVTGFNSNSVSGDNLSTAIGNSRN